MKRFWVAGPLCLALIGAAYPGAAQDVAATVQARHAHFKQIGVAMKGLSEQMKSPAPSLADVRGYAQRLDELAPQLPSWFPKGSGPESGQKTHSKADVWQKPDEFAKDAAAFAAQTHKLNVAALSGNLAAVAAQAPAVSAACKTCHQAFRERED